MQAGDRLLPRELVEILGDAGLSPEDDEGREENEGRPREEDAAEAELVFLGGGFAFITPDRARAPEFEEYGQQQERADPGDDVDQCGAHEVRPEELQAAEDEAAG